MVQMLHFYWSVIKGIDNKLGNNFRDGLICQQIYKLVLISHGGKNWFEFTKQHISETFILGANYQEMKFILHILKVIIEIIGNIFTLWLQTVS